MTIAKHDQLNQAISAIHRRWGPLALQSSVPASSSSSWIATGFPTLDTALATGIPRGRITELLGRRTSGMRTLALRILAHAQRQGELTAYLDLQETFDPEYAAYCEVDLAHVLLVRPAHGDEALAIVHALLATGEVGAIVVDGTDGITGEQQGQQKLANALCRCLPLLGGAQTALIFLTPCDEPSRTITGTHPADALAHSAAVRLCLEHEHWLHEQDDVSGYQVKVSVLKHKRAPAIPPTSLTINLPAV